MGPSQLKQALAKAPDAPTGSETRLERELFCFGLGELELGVPSGNVREVLRAGPLTPLPRSASFLMGVSGHRGEVLPVIDLLRYLGRGESHIGPRSRLFVAVASQLSAAIVTDAVFGLRKVAQSEILPPPMGGDAAQEHLIGVVSQKNGRALNLLDLSKLLAAARQRAVVR